MKIKELRELTGMSQSQFADYFNIPIKTVQNWETDRRKCADYIVDLIEYKLRKEKIIK
nr:MAG TPA: putative transcriptional regulator [Caudoviricetes sp.]